MSGTPIAGDYIYGRGQGGTHGRAADGDRGRGRSRARLPCADAASMRQSPHSARTGVEAGAADARRTRARSSTPSIRTGPVRRPLHRPPARGADDLLRSGAARRASECRATPLPQACPTTHGALRDGGSGAARVRRGSRGLPRLRCRQAARTTASAICSWRPTDSAMRDDTFGRQAIPMILGLRGGQRPLRRRVGDLGSAATGGQCVQKALSGSVTHGLSHPGRRGDSGSPRAGKVVSTDPPYYDNIGYADLSDFFYVWLRRSLKPRLPGSLRHDRRAQGGGAGRDVRTATAARRRPRRSSSTG